MGFAGCAHSPFGDWQLIAPRFGLQAARVAARLLLTSSGGFCFNSNRVPLRIDAEQFNQVSLARPRRNHGNIMVTVISGGLSGQHHFLADFVASQLSFLALDRVYR